MELTDRAAPHRSSRPAFSPPIRLPALPASSPGRALLGLLLALPCLECASPGPPRSPSLQLPAPVRDLVALRVGEGVDLHFTVPRDTTDGARVRSSTLLGTVCRSEGNGACSPFAGGPQAQSFPVADSNGGPLVASFRDPLTPALRSGPLRLLSYRVEFFNLAHRSAGASEPAYTAAGSAPPPVESLSAEGSRSGVLLRWQPAPAGDRAEVLLHRTSDSVAGAEPRAPSRKAGLPGVAARPPAEASGAVWLQANLRPPGLRGSQAATLDDSAVPGQTYSYTAQRKLKLQLGLHGVEMRSELSAPVTLRLQEIFPPPAPRGLTAAGYTSEGRYAVDLIWEPVEDPGVSGYLVSRSARDQQGRPSASPVLLTSSPVELPAFHDSSADPTARYRYEVIAVDYNGTRSTPASTVVDPLSTP